MKLKGIREIRLIERFAKTLRTDRSVIKSIGDDTAVVRWTNTKYLLLTCDMLIEDVHFTLAKAAPFQIGWKALACNISDIAAMGGVPRYALVSVGLNPNLPLSFADGLFKGLKTLADRFKINIVGGDTNASEKVVIDVALVGEVEKRNLVTRSGAQEGDVIFVTGSLGGSIRLKHLTFIPRVAEARRLVKDFKINAMIDISDSLVLDLNRILNASGVGSVLYENTIPRSDKTVPLGNALYDGEDFELLFTMSVREARRFFKTALVHMKTPVTLIGEIVNKRYGYKLVTKDGFEKTLKGKGYTHFR